MTHNEQNDLLEKILLVLKDVEMIADQLTTGNVSHKQGQIVGMIRLCREKLLLIYPPRSD